MNFHRAPGNGWFRSRIRGSGPRLCMGVALIACLLTALPSPAGQHPAAAKPQAKHARKRASVKKQGPAAPKAFLHTLPSP